MHLPQQEVPDRDTVTKDDIVLKLGKPSQSTSSARALTVSAFAVDTSTYNLT